MKVSKANMEVKEEIVEIDMGIIKTIIIKEIIAAETMVEIIIQEMIIMEI